MAGLGLNGFYLYVNLKRDSLQFLFSLLGHRTHVRERCGKAYDVMTSCSWASKEINSSTLSGLLTSNAVPSWAPSWPLSLRYECVRTRRNSPAWPGVHIAYYKSLLLAV